MLEEIRNEILDKYENRPLTPYELEAVRIDVRELLKECGVPEDLLGDFSVIKLKGFKGGNLDITFGEQLEKWAQEHAVECEKDLSASRTVVIRLRNAGSVCTEELLLLDVPSSVENLTQIEEFAKTYFKVATHKDLSSFAMALKYTFGLELLGAETLFIDLEEAANG